ncbi:hypothetical protein [Roseinatronobacter monicus]|uniref:hypothetical protein n=1 Tax=Roseinatronobacter monicus TaxID=393481 RepID=UPI0011513DE4|nr:hypothetical protein [Roseinatronobacter monicus]
MSRMTALDWHRPSAAYGLKVGSGPGVSMVDLEESAGHAAPPQGGFVHEMPYWGSARITAVVN